MSKCLRVFRYVLLTAMLLLLSLVPSRSQQIELEIASAAVTRNLNGDAAISITMSAESRRAFAAFSKEVAGRIIEIRSASDVLSIVRLQTSIEGGVLQFTLRGGDATEAARKLSGSGAKVEIRLSEERR